MAVKRYLADLDTTITDAFKSDLSTRGTGSNMGASDILETFSIYAQATTASLERSRILTRFPISTITTDRTNSDIPASGSVSFYLRLHNAPHGQTLPRSFTLTVAPVSRSWEEGHGLDMEEYTDLTHDGTGSNWINAAGGTTWTAEGGDYHTGSRYDVTFDEGTEDMEIDISSLVEQWITGSTGGGYDNYGVGVFLTASQESGSSRTYYTKKFFSRTSEFFFKRPTLEARWDSSEKDNRGNFYYSSSLAPAADNLNTLYLYNYVRGQLKNIPSIGKGSIYVDLYSGSGTPSNKLKLSPGGGVSALGSVSTGSWVSVGIYSASLSITSTATPLTKLYDVWHNGSTTQFFTGTITPVSYSNAVGGPGGHGSMTNPNPSYVSAITNLRSEYDSSETSTRIRLYTRLRDWSPNIYTVASTDIETNIVEDAYYKVFRIADDLEVIKYGTGSLNETRVSYDRDGSYFDLDMSLLEPGYAYGLKLVYYINNSYREQPETFKFRVEQKQKQ